MKVHVPRGLNSKFVILATSWVQDSLSGATLVLGYGKNGMGEEYHEMKR